MLPAVFGSSVAQVNLLVNTLLASFLVNGSVAWLYYSDRLMEFPLGVFGIALATVTLPSLSRAHVNKTTDEFSQLLDWAMRWVVLVSVPAAVGLIALAEPMLVTLFMYGKFGVHDVTMSGRALIAFALGLPAFILVKILASGFYARQNTQTPARIAALSVGANIVLSLALIYPLAHMGLALAISLAAFVNAALLFHLLRREDAYTPLPGWGALLLRVAVASTVMGLAMTWGAGELSLWTDAGVPARILRLGILVAVGVVVYIAGILLLGVRPRELVLRRVQVGTNGRATSHSTDRPL